MLESARLIHLTFVLCSEDGVNSSVRLHKNKQLLTEKSGNCTVEFLMGEHEKILNLGDTLEYVAIKNNQEVSKDLFVVEETLIITVSYGLKAGAIVGILAGVIILVGGAIFAVLFILKNRKRYKAENMDLRTDE